jgi:hypothetical protein
MRRLVATLVLSVGLIAIPALTLAAEPPASPNCFGAGASQLAQSATGAMGAHSSSFDEPRLGIGNVAEFFTGTHQPGLLGIALGADCE